MPGTRHERRVVDRHPKTALLISLLIECLGILLIFFDGIILVSFAWILMDALISGQKPAALTRMILLILPVACLTTCITALNAPDGRLILDGLVTAEGLDLGLQTGLRLVMMTVFARTCLLRFGIGPVLVQLSWVLLPLKLLHIGPRLASRTVLRSLFMIPQYASHAVSILGLQSKRRGLPPVHQKKRLDSRRRILVSIGSVSVGCALLVIHLVYPLQKL